LALIFDSLGITALYGGIILLMILQRIFLPGKGLLKQALLLLADVLVLSCLVPPLTILVTAVLAMFCYGVALCLQKYTARAQRRTWMFLLLTANILLLLIWWVLLKYPWPKAFLRASSGAFFADKIDLIATIGLSYIFFKLIHTLVDAYRGLLPDLNLFTFLNYIFFFPTYLSGPIDRFQNFHHWINRESLKADELFFKAAFFRIFLGVVKKFILVPFFIFYAKDYGQVHLSSVYLINVAISLFAYSFYLYFDFSGYSDLAIGVAMLLGFRAPENFDAPYRARDIAEFWKRWHISLSSILREYIFLPLVRGISKHFTWIPRLAGTICGYLVTFLLCGLWHGTTLNFVLWGLWHGAGLAVHKVWAQTPFSQKLQQVKCKTVQNAFVVISIAITFCYVSFGWLFFNYSLNQIASIQAVSRLKLTAAPHYFYGNTYTWGIRLKYRPISARDKMDIDIRAKGKSWVHYADAVNVGSGTFNVYGERRNNAVTSEFSYNNLLPGDYQLRLHYQRADRNSKQRVILPVTIPDYLEHANLTADDLEAKACRLTDTGWGIRLKYHPPTRDAKVDIEYRPLQSDSWVRYRPQHVKGFRFAHIIKVQTGHSKNQSLEPGVYCIRIRYINPKKGYFSDWTERSVHIPTGPNPSGDNKDEIS